MLLARGFGVTKTQVLEAIDWGAFYGGHEALNLVDRWRVTCSMPGRSSLLPPGSQPAVGTRPGR